MTIEDPWTREGVDFHVPKEYAEQVWKRKVYHKPPYWRETGKSEMKEGEGVARGRGTTENRPCPTTGRSYGPSPFHLRILPNHGTKVSEPNIG